MTVAPVGLANRKKFVAQGGDFICLDWWDIHPEMGPDTRPDQGFQRRLKSNAGLAGMPTNWAWCGVGGVFYLVRAS